MGVSASLNVELKVEGESKIKPLGTWESGIGNYNYAAIRAGFLGCACAFGRSERFHRAP